MDNRDYVFKTLEEAKRIRPEAIAFYKLLKGCAQYYIKPYYCHNQILEDKSAGYIRGESL